MDSPSRRNLAVLVVGIQTLVPLQLFSSARPAALRECIALVVLHITLVRIAVLAPSSRTGIAVVLGNGTLVVVGIEVASHIEPGLGRIEVVAQEHTRIGPVRVAVRIAAVVRTCIEVGRLAVVEVVRGIEVQESR
jgi:hypothetical protein